MARSKIENRQVNMFQSTEYYRIKKPIRLIELFAGYIFLENAKNLKIITHKEQREKEEDELHRVLDEENKAGTSDGN